MLGADWHHTFASFDAGTGGLVDAHRIAFQFTSSCLHSASFVGVVSAATLVFVSVAVNEVTIVPIHPLLIKLVLDFFGTTVEVVLVTLVGNAGNEFVKVDVVFAFVLALGAVR